MGRTTIRKVFVASPKNNGGRPDYYIVTNFQGNKLKVGTKERALEVAQASRNIARKRKMRNR